MTNEIENRIEEIKRGCGNYLGKLCIKPYNRVYCGDKIFNGIGLVTKLCLTCQLRLDELKFCNNILKKYINKGE